MDGRFLDQDRLALVSGRLPHLDDPDEVIVNEVASKLYGLHTGDRSPPTSSPTSRSRTRTSIRRRRTAPCTPTRTSPASACSPTRWPRTRAMRSRASCSRPPHPARLDVAAYSGRACASTTAGLTLMQSRKAWGRLLVDTPSRRPGRAGVHGQRPEFPGDLVDRVQRAVRPDRGPRPLRRRDRPGHPRAGCPPRPPRHPRPRSSGCCRRWAWGPDPGAGRRRRHGRPAGDSRRAGGRGRGRGPVAARRSVSSVASSERGLDLDVTAVLGGAAVLLVLTLAATVSTMHAHARSRAKTSDAAGPRPTGRRGSPAASGPGYASGSELRRRRPTRWWSPPMVVAAAIVAALTFGSSLRHLVATPCTGRRATP